MEPLNTELQPAKRRGRPKTVTVDKKEYRKQYYQKNKDNLLVKHKEYNKEHKEEIKEYQKEYQKDYRKEYIENLKETNPEKFQELRDRQNELSKELHRRERELFKLVLQLYENGEIVVPETYKESISELLCI